jgi:NAD(P)H dehydrogenase (quinone)
LKHYSSSYWSPLIEINRQMLIWRKSSPNEYVYTFLAEGEVCGMKHAVIVAHPSKNSFTSTVASTYRDAGLAAGQEVIYRDLYAMHFDPCLPEVELPWSMNFAVRDDVLAERALLNDVDVFALFYPMWLNAPPAILKGYLERVFGIGFAYRSEGSGNAPMLVRRKLICFTSSGAPSEWVIQSGAWHSMRALFDSHFATVCGLEVTDHIHFGGIVPGIRADAVERDLERVRNVFNKNFSCRPESTSQRRHGTPAQ